MANENYVCKIIYEIHKENSRIWENWVLIDASNRKSGPLVWQLHAVDALPAPFRIRKISINSTNWQPVFVVCSQTVHTTHFSLRIIFLTNSNGAPAAVRYMIGTLLTPDVRLKPSPKATHVIHASHVLFDVSQFFLAICKSFFGQDSNKNKAFRACKMTNEFIWGFRCLELSDLLPTYC